MLNQLFFKKKKRELIKNSFKVVYVEDAPGGQRSQVSLELEL